MNITECTDIHQWETFIKQTNPASYFQSWEWGDIESEQGRAVWRLVISHNRRIEGVCQIVKVVARRGTFLHMRHGPVLTSWDTSGVFDVVMSRARDIARAEHASFIRISPLIDPSYASLLSSNRFLRSPVHNMDAEIVSVVDLSSDEDVLLKNMRKTTRNLIRRAIKDGVVVRESSDIETFMSLYRKTAERHDFVGHTAISLEYEAFKKNGAAELLIAYHEGVPLAGAIIIDSGGQAMYRHGASVPSKIPAAYLLQWEAIKRARNRGLKEYNLYGIADTDRQSHPWWGLTVFKKGFGGETRQYLHAHDLPLTMMYWLTYAIETVRTWKRGY